VITTAPGLNLRQSQLLAQIRQEGGQWPTGRALTWYQQQGLTNQRTTARGDLKQLTKLGYTVCIAPEGADRYFLLDTRVGANA
jgi:hypothetical protein